MENHTDDLRERFAGSNRRGEESSSCSRHLREKNGHNNEIDFHGRKRRLGRSAYSSGYRSKRKSPKIKCDERGHIVYQTGDIIYDRYKIIRLLGEGTFGRCLQCFDIKSKGEVALKVIRNVKKYRESAHFEIDTLKELHSKYNDLRSKLCIDILKWFEFQGHVCMVFPCIGLSVYDFMNSNNSFPFTPIQVQHISYQIIIGIEYLHSLKLIHTDLKPENILFVNSDYKTVDTPEHKRYKYILNTDIKIIDFGSSTYESDHHSKVVCTRHYRPPEVILETGWSYPVDMWSIGAMIFELVTGKAMFMTHDNHEHLLMMEIVLGPLPSSLIEETKKHKYFVDGKLCRRGRNIDKEYKSFNLSNEYESDVYNLISELLEYCPEKRMNARIARRHELFDELRCSWANEK